LFEWLWICGELDDEVDGKESVKNSSVRISNMRSLDLYTITANTGQLFLTKTVSFCFPFKQIVK